MFEAFLAYLLEIMQLLTHFVVVEEWFINMNVFLTLQSFAYMVNRPYCINKSELVGLKQYKSKKANYAVVVLFPIIKLYCIFDKYFIKLCDICHCDNSDMHYKLYKTEMRMTNIVNKNCITKFIILLINIQWARQIFHYLYLTFFKPL